MELTPDTAPPEEGGSRYLQMLAEWQDVCAELAAAKEREIELRRLLFAGAFPNPKEGTNTYKLPDGRAIKGGYTITRKLDEAVIQPAVEALRDHGVANWDRIVKWKPELAKAEWNTLSDAAKLLFSVALIATPGTPSLEIVAPAKGRGK